LIVGADPLHHQNLVPFREAGGVSTRHGDGGAGFNEALTTWLWVENRAEKGRRSRLGQC
jgi:hypothetical protein